MNRMEKFLKKVDASLRVRIIHALEKLGRGEADRLDIKPLTGYKGWYRCRVGDVRIIFRKDISGDFIVENIDFRGRVYTKRRQ